MPLRKFAVMVSGGGTDLQSIIDSDAREGIACVISSKDGVYSLERCKKAGIPAYVVKKSDYSSKEEFDGAILKILKSYNAEFVVLAGYLQILGETLINEYENKIINIHPSLIPSFCGMGYYGLKVHQAVLDYGAKITGVTVHFVDVQADHGPIIAQIPVEVKDDDTAETLQQRVLAKEHEILPKAVLAMAQGKIEVNGRKVVVKD